MPPSFLSLEPGLDSHNMTSVIFIDVQDFFVIVFILDDFSETLRYILLCLPPYWEFLFECSLNSSVLNFPKWNNVFLLVVPWSNQLSLPTSFATFCTNSSLSLVAKLCPTLVTLWTAACRAPLYMGFSRQEHWSALQFTSPGDLPDPGIKPRSPAPQADSSPLELQGKPIKVNAIP